METVDDLRKSVRERLEGNKKASAERSADSELYKALSEAAEIDLPQVMIDDEAEQMVNQSLSQLQQYGMDPSQYLKMMGQTIDQLKESYKEQAEQQVRLRLVLEEIAKQEQIEVSDEELENEYQDLAKAYNLDVQRIKASIGAEMLKQDILNRKAGEFVKEHAARD